METFLEGDVRPLPGGGLEIEARLFKPNSNVYLWAKSYQIGTNGLGDLDGIEQEIAAGAARAAGVPGVVRQRTALHENPKARALYLQARFLLRTRGAGPHYPKAEPLFQKAIEIDPNYAKAYAGLADYFAYRVANHIVEPGTELQEGIAAARKAMALDPNLAEAHAALGLLKFCAWDFGSAKAEYAMALRIDPNLATAYNRRALVEYAQGDFPDAEQDLLRARDLDPLNLNEAATLIELYYYWRRYGDALRLANQVLAADPNYEYARYLEMRVRWAQGRREEAARLARSLAARGDENPLTLMLAGRRDWRERLAKLHAADASIAIYYAAADDKKDCFRYLERAFADRDPDLISLRWDPVYDTI
ncbi:MAG: tetratricopeptide repeat protein, partial [Bryobacteraceae bacterium]